MRVRRAQKAEMRRTRRRRIGDEQARAGQKPFILDAANFLSAAEASVIRLYRHD
jgi:hypothetical protein